MKKESTLLKIILLSMILLPAPALVSCNGNKAGYSIEGTIEADLISIDSISMKKRIKRPLPTT